MKKILITTTDIIQGKNNLEYIGIVTAENVVGVNIVRDFFAGITDLIGGRSRTLEKALKEAREECLKELEERAIEAGADGVVGVSIETQISNMVTVTASGTMVKFI
jgi:uncharacterized protein YbjQ (UPF0145 family)